jgi:fatty-acyl-CoA synthase
VNLSYVHGSGTTPLLADTIGAALNTAAARWADRDALISCHQQLRYSYAQLRHEADRVARALLDIMAVTASAWRSVDGD